jgi:hypothetical protein
MERRDQPAPPASSDRTVSRLEQMAEVVATVCSTRQEILGLLLGTTSPLAYQGPPVLRPLWASEAMQRAYDLIRLVACLERSVPLRAYDLAAACAERKLARELAATFRALDLADDKQILPCSDLLRALMRDLVELFGPVGGGIDVRTSIEPLLLPADKRRALLLAAYALVANLLGSELTDSNGGVVMVTLSRVGESEALFRVVDSGRRLRGGDCIRRFEVIADLANLLESDPVYRIEAAGGVAAEIVFPVQRTNCAVQWG